MDAGVRVDEDAFGGKTLRAVTGNGIAMVEVTIFAGVELDLTVVVDAGGDAAIGMNRHDRAQVAVSDATLTFSRFQTFNFHRGMKHPPC